MLSSFLSGHSYQQSKKADAWKTVAAASASQQHIQYSLLFATTIRLLEEFVHWFIITCLLTMLETL